MLTRDAILKAKVPTVAVEVPEWGGPVTIRSLTPLSRIELLDAIYANEEAVRLYNEDQAKDADERAGLEKVTLLDQSFLHLMWCIVDPETMKPLFGLADYRVFLDLPQSILNHLYAQLMILERRTSPLDQKKS